MNYQEQTPSGIPVRPVYGPGDRPAHEPPPGHHLQTGVSPGGQLLDLVQNR